jgi:ATP-dependent Clp protease, protease subunit
MQELEGLLEIPSQVENLQLPSPELLNFYKDVKNRSIWISDVDDSLLEFMKLILQWNREDAGKTSDERLPIRVHIFSYGGDADACFAFISLIKLSKTPVAGHKKLAMDGSTILIHQGSGAIGGTAGQIVDASEAYAKLLDKMKNFILENTKISKAVYNKMKKNEWTILSDKFLEYGIADEIISDIDSIL